MPLTRTFMLERSRDRDAKFDGRFLTGVLSTGIYCLPSCPARKPKAENVRFFGSEPDAPVSSIAERLTAVRGLGPWSVQYILMRGFGFADCVPVGDSGLVTALATFFDLAERPGRAETTALMAPFAPHRSLATFHLWNQLGDPA